MLIKGKMKDAQEVAIVQDCARYLGMTEKQFVRWAVIRTVNSVAKQVADERARANTIESQGNTEAPRQDSEASGSTGQAHTTDSLDISRPE